MGRIQTKVLDTKATKDSRSPVDLNQSVIKILVGILVIVGAYGFGTFKSIPVVKKSKRRRSKRWLNLQKNLDCMNRL